MKREKKQMPVCLFFFFGFFLQAQPKITIADMQRMFLKTRTNMLDDPDRAHT